MSTPFARLESIVNNKVVNRLANKVFVINALLVHGVFDAQYNEVEMIESSDPIFTALSSDLTGVSHGSIVEEADGAGRTFDVVSVQPDSSGFTTLELRLKWDT